MKRQYVPYTSEELEQCVQKVKSGKMSQRKAARLYKIPRSTLMNKLRNCHRKKVGRPTALSEKDEKGVAERINLLCSWGFPLDQMDIRVMIKRHLDNASHKAVQFKSNQPGRRWIVSFMKRHNLVQRIVGNIKRRRSEVCPRIIHDYFDNIERELHDVPPQNIWNFDETACVDDPGRRKFVIKRGLKYPERVINSSKVNFSVMFCGNAAGEMMPPYVVYKAAHLYTDWTMGGPPNTRYNRSKSGWFEAEIFVDWFKTLLFAN